jgi:hypothetical protein
VFSFRQALIDIAANWANILRAATCPIHFTELELERHRRETELMERLECIMQHLESEHMIPLGGIVWPEDYERSRILTSALRRYLSLRIVTNNSVRHGHKYGHIKGASRLFMSHYFQVTHCRLATDTLRQLQKLHTERQ